VKWAGIGRAFVQFEKLPQSSTQFGVGGLQRSPSVIELRSKCPFATGTVDLRASFRNVFSNIGRQESSYPSRWAASITQVSHEASDAVLWQAAARGGRSP
jgi:hypothetical protein